MGNFAATMELQGLLSQGQNERAFALALGKNDPGILMWLCGKLEPKVLGGPPGVGLPMSQIIVMSLLQQLGADLQNETKLKIGWIKACLSVLNPADPQVAPNAGRVLSQLGERLTSAADALRVTARPRPTSRYSCSRGEEALELRPADAAGACE